MRYFMLLPLLLLAGCQVGNFARASIEFGRDHPPVETYENVKTTTTDTLIEQTPKGTKKTTTQVINDADVNRKTVEYPEAGK